MPHFYVAPSNVKNNSIIITKDEAHHLINVRRVKIGDELNVFDGTGRQYVVKVEEISKDDISAVIVLEKFTSQPKMKLNIYQAVPKGERADWIVEKFTELGVSKFVPLVTERSVIKEITEQKLNRWGRLSTAAAKQCLRPEIMEIAAPETFGSALDIVDKNSINLIPWEGSDTVESFEKVLKKEYNKSTVCNIFIGPEGGFAYSEIELAKKAGLVPVSLGHRILRVETASLLSVILAMNYFGEWR